MQTDDEGGGGWESIRGKSSSSQESVGGREQWGMAKVMRMDAGSQAEEFKVIFKLKGGQAGFSSFNPIQLARALKEILNTRILADGKLIVFCKSAAQLTKAAALEAIGKKQVEGFVPWGKAGLKGVIYGVSLEISIEELVKGIDGAQVSEASRIRVFRDGTKHNSTVVV